MGTHVHRVTFIQKNFWKYDLTYGGERGSTCCFMIITEKLLHLKYFTVLYYRDTGRTWKKWWLGSDLNCTDDGMESISA